ncbi:MAG: TIGR01777 family oxidoreductase [Leptospira sp.]|nr:TIGR01777 family oxidoreductase [Leptospira sp.]
MKIGILGGTGLIGKEFILYAVRRGHSFRVFSRRDKLPKEFTDISGIELVTCSIPNSSDLEGLDVVLNLVGEPIAGIRWTDERKKMIETSRVDFTRGLVARVSDTKNPPKLFLQASAVGYYGMTEESHIPFTESSPPAEDFLAKLCVDWEKQVDPIQEKKIRTVVLRTGIVLSPKGGALEKMLPPFRLGLGGAIASGKQGMSWIHIVDFLSALLYFMETPSTSGAYNLTAPNPVTNEEFSKVLAATLGRPNLFRVPSLAVQALFGEGSVVVTKGQFVVPEKLIQEGFVFQFPKLEYALNNLLKGN